MSQHDLVQSSEVISPTFPCNIRECGKSFASIQGLSRHKRSHFGEKKHGCTVCHKRFDRADNLKLHMEIHRDVKKRACECGKSYKSARSLQRHQKLCKNKSLKLQLAQLLPEDMILDIKTDISNTYTDKLPPSILQVRSVIMNKMSESQDLQIIRRHASMSKMKKNETVVKTFCNDLDIRYLSRTDSLIEFVPELKNKILNQQVICHNNAQKEWNLVQNDLNDEEIENAISPRKQKFLESEFFCLSKKKLPKDDGAGRKRGNIDMQDEVGDMNDWNIKQQDLFDKLTTKSQKKKKKIIILTIKNLIQIHSQILIINLHQ